ncbi:Transcription elongation factor spt6 [Linnemannia zychae]|nr:Transcription elongation factor spt6 [Linnemannia zychae]
MSNEAEKQRRPRRRILSDEEDDEDELLYINNRGQRNIGHGDNNDAGKEDYKEDDNDDNQKEPRNVGKGLVADAEMDGDDSVEGLSSKKGRKRKDTIEVDLEDDDLDLVEENTGMKIQRPERFKRLKKHRQHYGKDEYQGGDSIQAPARTNHDPLARLFDDTMGNDSDEENGGSQGGETEDDMDEFIDDEEEDEDDQDIIEHQRNRQLQAASLKSTSNGTSTRNYNEEMNEWHGVFGDGQDYAYALSKENGEGPYGDPLPERHIKDVFEPGVLADKMLTDVDDVIRLKDVPERMQMRPGIQTDRLLTDLEIELEAYWVATALSDNPRRIGQPMFDSVHIQSVLKFMSQELMEVPFIDLHRQDYFTEVHGHEITRLLSRDDLWFIYDEDYKFRSFLERKEAISALVDRLHISDDYLRYSLLRAERLEELTDISDYINLKYSKRTEGENASLLRRPGSAGLYDPGQREELSQFITILGMTTQEFGTNLSEGNKRYFPKENNMLPDDAAQPYVGPAFASAQRAITMAVGMTTQEVAVDPLVRRAIRTQYETAGCVTVTPTEKGASTIDELHPYYPFKRLTQKNVREFHDGQFLQILQAQSEGLLKINIGIPDEDQYIQNISAYYLSDGFGRYSEAWDSLRAQIISSALRKHIFVIMERGTIEKLRVQAEEWVGLKCQAALEERMNVAPFVVPGKAEGEETIPRVVAISHGPGSSKDAIQVVYVDEKGRFIEHKKLDNLRDQAQQEELLDFLDRRRADVVVVGGFSVATRRLLEQTESVVNEHRTSTNSQVSVIMTNDEVAKLYQSSKRGIEDHPKAYEITRYCISLARTIQNPVNEYAATGADLVGIRLHPLQEFVGADRLRELLDRALVNVVNDIGVDINEVVLSPYKAVLLPYICGLGTRKADNLIRSIERDSATRGVNRRSDLVYRKILAWNIFMNCCSFLRVHTEHGGDILDETRIHFEDYNLARKMAADALEIDEEGLQGYEEESQHVEELMRDNRAEKLNELLLEDYALQLEQIQKKPKRMTLEHIKAELQHPFGDPRKAFLPADSDQIFTMLTGETDQTLREGFIVAARVIKVREKSALCRLDCGIDGMLAIRNISDSRVESIEDHLSEGQTLQVKILRLEKDRFFADLTCKESELSQGDMEVRKQPVDRTFNQYEEERAMDQVDLNTRQPGFVPRKINHPLFKNITSEAATKYLSPRRRGELVIRPSHRGTDHLIVTVKIAEGIFKHYDILESQKTDEIRLGKVLTIDNSTYHDLDELLVSHIAAILSRIQDLMESPKYHENEYELKQWLEKQTQARPSSAVYGFTLSHKYPGYFSLIFKLGHAAKIDEWNIKVLPEYYQLKGPSRRDCKDPVAISDNFKDMAMRISSRRSSKKPPTSTSVSGSVSGSNHGNHGHNHGYGNGYDYVHGDGSAYEDRSQSHYRRSSVSSTVSAFSSYSKPTYSEYGSASGANAPPVTSNRGRSRSRHQSGYGGSNSNLTGSGGDAYSSTNNVGRSRSTFRGDRDTNNTGDPSSFNRARSRSSHPRDNHNSGSFDRARSRSRHPGDSNNNGFSSDRGRGRSVHRTGSDYNNTDFPDGSRRSKSAFRGDGSISAPNDQGRSRPRYPGDHDSHRNNGKRSRSRHPDDGDSHNNNYADSKARARSRHRGDGGSNNDGLSYGASRSGSRHRGGQITSNYEAQIGTSTNNIPIGDRSMSKGRSRAEDTFNFQSDNTGFGSTYHQRGSQDSSASSFQPSATSYRQYQPIVAAALSRVMEPEKPAPRADPSKHGDTMDFTAYSPEPMAPAESDNPADSASQFKQFGGDEDDAGGINWGSSSWGGGGGSYGGRGGSHGIASRSHGSGRQEGRRGQYDKGRKSDPPADRRPYQSQAPQQQSHSSYSSGSGYGPKNREWQGDGSTVNRSMNEEYSPESQKPTTALAVNPRSSQGNDSSAYSSDLTAFEALPHRTQSTTTSGPDQPKDTVAYSPEPMTSSDQPMEFTAYSPEPTTPAEPDKPSDSVAKSKRFGGDEDDAGGINWGGSSWGGGGDGRSRPYGSGCGSFSRGSGQYGNGGRSNSPVNRRPYQSQSSNSKGSDHRARDQDRHGNSNGGADNRSRKAGNSPESQRSKPTSATNLDSSQPNDSSVYSPEPRVSADPATSKATSSLFQPKDTGAFSPAPAEIAMSSDQHMEFTAYSPEPMAPAEPEVPADDASQPRQFGGGEDDASGIDWGSSSYGGGNSSYGGGSRSFGGGNSSYGSGGGSYRGGRRESGRGRNDGGGGSGTPNYGSRGDNGHQRNERRSGVRHGEKPTQAAGGGGYGSSYGNGKASGGGGNDYGDGGISWGSGSYGGGGDRGRKESGNGSGYGGRGRDSNRGGYNDRSPSRSAHHPTYGSRSKSRPRSKSRHR